MLIWSTVAVLTFLWLLGMITHVGGGMIHGLFLIAAILVMYNLFARDRVWG